MVNPGKNFNHIILQGVDEENGSGLALEQAEPTVVFFIITYIFLFFNVCYAPMSSVDIWRTISFFITIIIITSASVYL